MGVGRWEWGCARVRGGARRAGSGGQGFRPCSEERRVGCKEACPNASRRTSPGIACDTAPSRLPLCAQEVCQAVGRRGRGWRRGWAGGGVRRGGRRGRPRRQAAARRRGGRPVRSSQGGVWEAAGEAVKHPTSQTQQGSQRGWDRPWDPSPSPRSFAGARARAPAVRQQLPPVAARVGGGGGAQGGARGGAPCARPGTARARPIVRGRARHHG
jgi:hypothetical protein